LVGFGRHKSNTSYDVFWSENKPNVTPAVWALPRLIDL
jgi:hypothetical protein